MRLLLPFVGLLALNVIAPAVLQTRLSPARPCFVDRMPVDKPDLSRIEHMPVMRPDTLKLEKMPVRRTFCAPEHSVAPTDTSLDELQPLPNDR